MPDRRVGLLGAASLVGQCLISRLLASRVAVVAFSRRARQTQVPGVRWCELNAQADSDEVANWLCVAPIWSLSEHFSMLEAYGAQRVVVLSSTSRFTKVDSTDPSEYATASRLAEGEECVRAWAESKDIAWVILRPTLIYGQGQDKNIAEIARFIKRFGFFPLLGKAMGARQPIHAEDVAMACLAGLDCAVATNRAYNISGGETLPYREMVSRVFAALHLQPRLITIPLVAFKSAVALLRCLPRYRHWSAGMALRMNRDLVFDHSDAARDFGFSPKPFLLEPKDLP